MGTKHVGTHRLSKLEAQKAHEKSIYVVVARTVDAGDERIHMPDGRMAAQACHATGIYRGNQGDASVYRTIILEARNSKELAKLLTECSSFLNVESYNDYDREFYGVEDLIPTAFCIWPTDRSLVEPYLDHLERM